MDTNFAALNGLSDRAQDFATQVDLNTGDAVLVGISLLTLLGVAYFIKRWRKGRGLRMAIKDRNDKEHALLLDIIGDGLLQAEMDGKISRQRHRAICVEMAKKLGLRDLVPKEMLLEVVKQELKKKRFSTDPEMKRLRNYSPTIPGGPPTPIVRDKFVEVIGKFAKFRRAA